MPIGLFALAVQKRIRSFWLLVPLALIAWVLMHESGVHATVAGVLLGFTVPVIARSTEDTPDDTETGLAEHFEHLIRPLSAGIAVPVFAFFAAGVTVGGLCGLVESFRDPVSLGITAGLVVGKFVGILGTTYLVARFTKADLDEGLAWIDVAGLALLAGIGFTVSLLIGDLAFGPGSERDDHVKVGVLAGSIIAALLAAIVLRSRNRVYRRIELEESVDCDDDDIPDVYQKPQQPPRHLREQGPPHRSGSGGAVGGSRSRIAPQLAMTTATGGSSAATKLITTAAVTDQCRTTFHARTIRTRHVPMSTK